jgi:hypothetical protein
VPDKKRIKKLIALLHPKYFVFAESKVEAARFPAANAGSKRVYALTNAEKSLHLDRGRIIILIEINLYLGNLPEVGLKNGLI